MFDSVLIANRGEIAVRIIRTLRALGIRSIAVFSDADRTARHVLEADTAVRLGPAVASQSYLSVERVIDAALATGAEALHPGYGFLSENPRLAAACDEVGITFVGPPASAIEAMGDKIRAKRLVAAHGVRVVPGVDGAGCSLDELVAAAREVGVPALVKPSAGGGGKGMRLVTSADDWPVALAAAQREALASFGDPTLLVERYVERPRHLEVQILADGHGNIVHLGERECSLQRRHQKVLEETPSPLLDDQQRHELAQQAVAAARACGYVNAGTVEFVVSGEREDEAYFLEMNTRLQVEHPVTEMVWGIDLVEQQLRIAAGEPLEFTQSDLRPHGHAIEARIYAEDPEAGFLPTGGTVRLLAEPSGVDHVRVDSALRVGDTVGSDYDPMLAKVIAWGADRSAALRRLEAALGQTAVLGVVTNTSFVRDLVGDPAVVKGELDTGLIERFSLTRQPAVAPPRVLVAAAVTLLEATATTGAWGTRSGWRLGEPAVVSLRLFEANHRVGGEHVVEVRLRALGGGSWEASLEDWSAQVHAQLDGSCCRLSVDGVVHQLLTWVGASDVWLAEGGSCWHVGVAAAHGPGPSATEEAGLTVVSPMPGTVVSVEVAVGDRVEQAQAIVVVEAMKMEHTVRAPCSAVVAEVVTAVGERVDLHQTLAVLESIDE